MSDGDGTRSDASGEAPIPTYARGWQRLMERRIGIVPMPAFVLVAAMIWYFVAAEKLAADLPMMIAVVAIFGFACAEIGQRIPGVRSVGGGAIFATFLPSALVFYHVLSPVLVNAVTQFTKASNFLYLYIAAVIVGSVFGIDRTMLIRGVLKILAPLAAGTIAALIVGTAVGTLLGLGVKHTLLYIVIPVMAGGVGEGALPLAMGYAGMVHQPFGTQFAQVLPPVMIGSLIAILIAGALNTLGKKKPHLSGGGRLQPGEHDGLDFSREKLSGQVDVMHIAAATVTAVSLYLLGVVAQRILGLPAPVVMLFLAVLMKLSWSVTRQLQLGAEVVFQIFAKAGTYAIIRGRDPGEQVHRVVAFTGQSLGVPSSTSVLLRLGPNAIETPPRRSPGTPTPAEKLLGFTLYQKLDSRPDPAKLAQATERFGVGGRAQALALRVGRGRVVIAGETGMFSAQVFHRTLANGRRVQYRLGMNVPGNDDRQFVLNVLHWLSGALQ